MKTIVVGVDGSECAERALDFAVEEAACRGAALRIVSAWEIPPMLAPGAVYAQECLDSFPEDAETVVQKARARAAELQPSVPCEVRVAKGLPAHVLIEEAKTRSS